MCFLLAAIFQCWEKKTQAMVLAIHFPTRCSCQRRSKQNDDRRIAPLVLRSAHPRQKAIVIFLISKYTTEGKPLEASHVPGEMPEQHNLPERKCIRWMMGDYRIQHPATFRQRSAGSGALEDEFTNRLVDWFCDECIGVEQLFKMSIGVLLPQHGAHSVAKKRSHGIWFGGAPCTAEVVPKNAGASNNQFPSVRRFRGMTSAGTCAAIGSLVHAREQFARRLEYGMEILTNYYNK